MTKPAKLFGLPNGWLTGGANWRDTCALGHLFRERAASPRGDSPVPVEPVLAGSMIERLFCL